MPPEFASLGPQAKYFPVQQGGLTMRAGLFRHGTDFGNGERDAQYFQRDEGTPAALTNKAAVLEKHPQRFGWIEERRTLSALQPVLGWMQERVHAEVGPCPFTQSEAPAGFGELGRWVAEDFVVMQRRRSGEERCALAHVCAPSGWRPETIIGRSFLQIHDPVPEFGALRRTSEAVVRALFERGPYVRFVWTLTPDASLDHHPDFHTANWSDAQNGYLRVERQISVPFAPEQLSLFLIRTYLYPLEGLETTQREVIRSALEGTSDAVLEYKGLRPHLERILGWLRKP